MKRIFIQPKAWVASYRKRTAHARTIHSKRWFYIY